MRAEFSVVAQFLSEFEAEEPDIPTVASYSMIPLYRIAIYPSVVMLIYGFVAFSRAFISESKETKMDNKSEMAMPNQPSE